MPYIPALMLVAARVAGVLIVAPVFGHAAVPVRLRLFMSIVIALAVVARKPEPVMLPCSWFDLAMGLACELVLGAVIGMAARLLFVGVQLGALYVGQQMGISLPAVFNPLAEDASDAVRRLFKLLTVVLFLAIGGHRTLLAALMRSFQTIPPHNFVPGSAMLDMVVAMLAGSFLLALKVAAPILLALLLATVAMGFVQRTIPQCNLLSTGFPVRLMLGQLVLAAVLGVLPWLVERAWSLTAGRIEALLEVAG